MANRIQWHIAVDTSPTGPGEDPPDLVLEIGSKPSNTQSFSLTTADAETLIRALQEWGIAT